MLARLASRQLLDRLTSSGAVQSCRGFAEATGAPRIFGAAVLERLPVVTPDIPEWEQEHQAWLEQFRQRDAKEYPPEFIDPKRSGASGSGSDTSAIWQPASRITDADRSGDVRSLHRRLDQRMLLLLKSPGGEGTWHLPFAESTDSETMRETAERALTTATGQEVLRTYTVGNAPAGFHPQADGSGTLFFIKMQLLEGALTEPPEGQKWYDYAWAAPDELPQYFQHDPEQAQLLQDVM